MNFNLINNDDIADLPSDPIRRFAALEEVCRNRMMSHISRETSSYFDGQIRTQYMAIVAAAAEELGIEGIFYEQYPENVEIAFNEFLNRVSAVVVRILLRSSSSRDALSVRLANKTKGLIEFQLGIIKEAIASSEFNGSKKKRLEKKIEDFRTELHKERLNYAAAMSAIVFISAGVAVESTGFLADLPNALATITQLIGVDKELEDAETSRLGAPLKPKLLESQKKLTLNKTSRHVLYDDDIPF